MHDWYGGEPPNTYCRHGTYEGMGGAGVTRPDRAYANEEFFRVLKSARTINLKDNPSHAILEIEVGVDSFLALFNILKAPMNFSKRALTGEHGAQEIAMWEGMAWTQDQTRHYGEAVEEGDFQRALQLWNHAAETFLMQQVLSHGQKKGEVTLTEKEQRKHRGRGEGPTFRKMLLTAASQRHLPQYGATTAKITALAKTERRLTELMAKHRYLDKVGWEGEQALRVNQEMEIIQGKITRHLRSGNLAAGQGGDEGYWGNLCEEVGHTTLGIQACAKHVTRMLKEANQAARENRVRERSLELKVDWRKDGGRKSYLAVKEPSPPPTLVLRRDDGTITANPKEMHDLINRCWVEGVFNKKDTSSQHQDWMDFATKEGPMASTIRT